MRRRPGKASHPAGPTGTPTVTFITRPLSPRGCRRCAMRHASEDMAEVMQPESAMNFACIEDPAVVVAETCDFGAVGSGMSEESDHFEKLAFDQMDTLYRVARRLTRDG